MPRLRRTLAGLFFLCLVLASYAECPGWGSTTHRFINRKSVYHLPGSMLLFIQDSTVFADHASDADNRRSDSDTALYGEAPRHFLDIDNYPDFHNLPRSLDTLIALYGWERVKENGTLPWAITWTYDSLVQQLTRADWPAAIQTASDLGHYVGDGHQPLHVTENYNGQMSGNYGIHSRYESTMLNTSHFGNSLVITPGTAVYGGPSVLETAFTFLYHSNACVDTILQADTYAKAVTGWNGSGTPPAAYYNALWEKTRVMTLDQVQRSTNMLADFWYRAWVDAGLITLAVDMPEPDRPAAFVLLQNYPNPFNPGTTIEYELPVGGSVSMTVFSSTGARIAEPVHELQSAGRHRVAFDGTGLAAGVYFCRLQVGRFYATHKLLLLK